MNLPTPEELAKAIMQTSLTEEEKQEIFSNLPFISASKIIEIYNLLLQLYEEEKKFVREVKRVDLKYQIKVQGVIDRKKKEEKNLDDKNLSVLK